MRVKDVMTTQVVTAGLDATVYDVARLMAEHGISAVPIVDAVGTLNGIVSEADLLRRVETETERKPPWWLRLILGEESLAAEFVRAHGRRASDIMTRTVIAVDEDRPLKEVVDLMARRNIRRVLVLRDGRIAGIVSRADIVATLASQVPPDVQATDEDIRQSVLQRFEDSGLPAWQTEVTVTDGVVHLWGVAAGLAMGEALRVAAEAAPGVKQVENHLLTTVPADWDE